MPEFEFKAVDNQGKFVNGVSSAQNRESLGRILQDQGLFLMETVELGGGVTRSQVAGAMLARLSALWPKPKVSLKDVTFCTTQLSIMVRSALPILESLDGSPSMLRRTLPGCGPPGSLPPRPWT